MDNQDEWLKDYPSPKNIKKTIHFTLSNFEIREGKTLDLGDSRYDQTNNLVAFVAFVNISFDPLSDIEFVDNFEYEFDNLQVHTKPCLRRV